MSNRSKTWDDKHMKRWQNHIPFREKNNTIGLNIIYTIYVFELFYRYTSWLPHCCCISHTSRDARIRWFTVTGEEAYKSQRIPLCHPDEGRICPSFIQADSSVVGMTKKEQNPRTNRTRTLRILYMNSEGFWYSTRTRGNRVSKKSMASTRTHPLRWDSQL